MRAMIRSSFKAQVNVTDPQEISQLKMQAIVGLQNYVVFVQTGCANDKDRARLTSAHKNKQIGLRLAQESHGTTWQRMGKGLSHPACLSKRGLRTRL